MDEYPTKHTQNCVEGTIKLYLKARSND